MPLSDTPSVVPNSLAAPATMLALIWGSKDATTLSYKRNWLLKKLESTTKVQAAQN